MKTYQHPVTPAELSAQLKRLCEELVPGAAPLYVDVSAVESPANECFPLVEERVRSEGGTALFGWSLWEMPSVFIEAEFHAVWKSPTGSLLDISPKKEPTQRILFLPDPTRTYEGYQINNVRRALRADPAVTGFLATCDEEYEFLNRGDRKAQHGEITLRGADAAEFQQLQLKKAKFQMDMVRMHSEIGAYGPCWCGSGKKVKWCHGISK
jgi:hypothetical protein